MSELYKLYGGNSKGNGCVVMPATKQDIIDYCIANKEIANAIHTHVENSEEEEAMDAIYKGYSELKRIPYFEAKALIDNEGSASAMYTTGMYKVREIIQELDSLIEKQKKREAAV